MYPGTISFARFDYPSALPACVQERMGAITKGLQNFKIDDELYAKLQGSGDINVLVEADSMRDTLRRARALGRVTVVGGAELAIPGGSPATLL